MALVFYVMVLMFLMAVAKHLKASQIIILRINSTNHLGAQIVKTGAYAVSFKALYLGNGIMGACFQAPHAAPRQ